MGSMVPSFITTSTLEEVVSMNHEVKKAINDLKEREARFLVDSYYTIQKYRKAIGNQIRSLGDKDTNAVLNWLFDNINIIEKQIKRALDVYTDNFV